VVIGWVFFRIEEFPRAFTFLQKMFSLQSGTGITLDPGIWFYFGLAVIFGFFVYSRKGQAIQDAVYFSEYPNRRHVIMASAVLILLVLSISSITAFGFNPFIYFRF
jgi:alginate O-acetyltransferase complex protein AlgI